MTLKWVLMSDPVLLGDVASVVDCEHKTAPVCEPGNEFAFSVGTRALRGGGIDFSQAKHVDEETYRGWSRRAELRRGDVILAREAPIGGVGWVSGEPRICLGQRTVLVRALPESVDGRFLFYLLQSPQPQEWMHAHGEGSTVKHLNVSDVRRIRLDFFPPLDVQRRIAGVLGSLDDLIDTNLRLAESLRERCHAEYERVVATATDSVRPLADVLEMRYGKALPARARRPGRVPVVSSAGIVGVHDEPLVSGPGIVVGRKGSVGTVTWVSEDFFPIDTAFYVSTSESLLFIYFSLARAGLDQMNTDSAVPGLNRENALSVEVPWPEEEVITTFDAGCRSLWDASNELEVEARELGIVRDELLPLLMSGQVVPGEVA